MTKFEALVSASDVAVCILGNPEQGTFEMWPIETGSLCLTRRADFVGVICLTGMVPSCALAVELDETTTKALTASFVGIVERAITVVERGVKGHVVTPQEFADRRRLEN